MALSVMVSFNTIYLLARDMLQLLCVRIALGALPTQPIQHQGRRQPWPLIGRRSTHTIVPKEPAMKVRLISLTVAMTLLGLSVGCIIPDHGRGREPRWDERRDSRPEPRHDRDHDERREHMSGFAR